MFLCNTVLYSIRHYFHHQTLPQQVSFLLWFRVFILCGAISLFFPSSILDINWPGRLIFQFQIFLPFHIIHGVFKARILKCFAFPFSSGPCFVRTLHRDLSVLVALHGIAQGFTELYKAVTHVIIFPVFCDYGFHSGGHRSIILASSVSLLMDKDKRLVQASCLEGLTVGLTGSCSGGYDHAQ